MLKALAIVLLFLHFLPGYGRDFSYRGSDGSILYRFVPRTGTLHDLTVTYNGDFTFYPAHFGGITRFTLAGEKLHPWEGKHAVKLLAENSAGDTYEAVFRWTYGGESFDFTIKMRREAKSLVIEFSAEPGVENVLEFGFDRSEQTPAPKIITLPYGHNVLFSSGIFISGMIDHLASNASFIGPLHSYGSNNSAEYGCYAHYNRLTDGRRNRLHETIYITVSPEIADTFFRAANPVSPYRDFLKDRVIVDLWSERFENYRDALESLADMGMSDLFAIFHVWQKYGYDNGLPSTFPAGDAFGGQTALLDVLEVCRANGWLCALHTNYVDFYENSDVWHSGDVALDSSGAWVKSWYNAWTGMQSWLMKPSRALHYAGLYEPLIHNAFRTNAAFLDIHSSILPSYKVDYDAGVAGAGKQISTFEHYRDLLAYVRLAHRGPVAGEGFGSAAYIWAGYVDAIEADPRTDHDRGGSAVPLIVDYKLGELHRLFVPHGVGYLERFYLDKWEGYSKEELARYRVSQLAFGNAGFLANPFEKGIDSQEILKDYCFLKHLQRYYLSETPTQVLYRIDDDRLLGLSDALRELLPGIPAADLDDALNEALAMLKISYSGGFTLYINRSRSGTWDVARAGTVYRLPANGFLAFKGDEFLAVDAILDGKRTLYMYPKEPACCRVILPIVNLSGRKVLNRSLFSVEYINMLSWQTYPGNSEIAKYRIYLIEEGNWHLLGELAADTFSYKHRNVDREKQYTYALVTLDNQMQAADPVYAVVR